MESNMWPLGLLMGSGMKAPKSENEMRILEYLLAAKLNEQRQYDEAIKERQKALRGLWGDAVKQVMTDENLQDIMYSMKPKKGGEPSQADINKGIQNALQKRYEMLVDVADQQGMLPSVRKIPEPITPEPEKPGRGMITVTEDRPGAKYKKGTRAIQAPNGSQVIAEPQDDGTFKLKGRDIDAEGNHVWKPVKGSISAEELDNITSGQWTYAGEGEELKKSEPPAKTKAAENKNPPKQEPIGTKEKVEPFGMKGRTGPTGGAGGGFEAPIVESEAKNTALGNLSTPGSVDLRKGLKPFYPTAPTPSEYNPNPQPLIEAMKTLPRNKKMDEQLWSMLGKFVPKYTPEPDLWE